MHVLVPLQKITPIGPRSHWMLWTTHSSKLAANILMDSWTGFRSTSRAWGKPQHGGGAVDQQDCHCFDHCFAGETTALRCRCAIDTAAAADWDWWQLVRAQGERGSGPDRKTLGPESWEKHTCKGAVIWRSSVATENMANASRLNIYQFQEIPRLSLNSSPQSPKAPNRWDSPTAYKVYYLEAFGKFLVGTKSFPLTSPCFWILGGWLVDSFKVVGITVRSHNTSLITDLTVSRPCCDSFGYSSLMIWLTLDCYLPRTTAFCGRIEALWHEDLLEAPFANKTGLGCASHRMERPLSSIQEIHEV